MYNVSYKKKVKSEKRVIRRKRDIYICTNIYTHKASCTIILPADFSAYPRVSRLILQLAAIWISSISKYSSS